MARRKPMSQSTMNIYAIGGLGTDQRVFDHLHLHRPYVFLDWIPARHGESLARYAKRFSERIDPDAPFGIIGVSFGGMLAIEINKLLPAHFTILLSSASQYEDIPGWMRFGGHWIVPSIPKDWLLPPRFLLHWIFSIKTPTQKKALDDIIKDSDPFFLKWAIHQIATWRNSWEPAHLFRIHGDRDRLLPCPRHPHTSVIPGGGHFMVVDRAKLVSQHLNEIIEQEISNFTDSNP